ncbi:MAG: diacylglycerol O-acyltransferase / wax synthase [Solirubrobacteraceae bacterium]|nr:diacylglycerol O-acyltransferase / wax synthase [Solirubrobacteraceae bacterium]
MTAEPLSAADRSSLQAERGPINMSVAGALLFESGPGTTFDAITARVAERLHLLPRYRQRLEDPAFAGLASPVWIDDDGFDLGWHMRHGTLRTGSLDELAEYVALEMSRKLDRSRPLWELHVIEGVEGGRTALLPKMHHALVDGIAAIGIGMILLDPTPEPMPIEPPAGGWAPRSFDRKSHVARVAAGQIVRAQKLAIGSAFRALDTSPRRAAGDMRRATELAVEFGRQRPSAPMTPLNEPLSPNRRYAMCSAGLATIKAVGKAHGGTVNDTILAVVAGMLRRYFEVSGTDLRGRDPVALVPVSVRKTGDEDATGNHISTVFVDLPSSEPDFGKRVAEIGATMRELRESAAVRAGAILVGATGQVPPLMASMLVRAMGGVRAMNLVVSNVPGPQQTFYMNGATMQSVFPAVPLNPANQGLNVGVMSYDGQVNFGLLADANLTPGIDVAAHALRDELAQLSA